MSIKTRYSILDARCSMVAFVTLTLALMLFAEPILAGKSAKKAGSAGQEPARIQRGESRTSSQKSQQVAKPSSTLRDQRPSNAGKTLPIVTAPSQSSRPSTRASISMPSDLSSFSRTTRPSLRLPSSIINSRQPPGITPSRPTTPQPPIASGIRESFSSYLGGASSSLGKQASTNSGNRISSEITSRIGSLIGAREPSAPFAARPPTVSPSGRISPDIASRIGVQINAKESRPAVRKPSPVGSDNPISSGETSLISSLISTKQPAITTPGGLVHDNRLNVDTVRNSIGGENMRQKAKISNGIDSAKEGERGSSELLRGFRAIHKEPEKTTEGSRSSWLGIVSAKIRAAAGQAETGKTGSQISRRSKDINLSVGDGTLRDSSVEEVLPEARTTTTAATINTEVLNNAYIGGRAFISHHERAEPSRVIYHDRPHLIRHTPHYQYVYRDWHNWLCYRPVWPTYGFCVYYNRGPCFTFRYVHPYYHRKYIFVSLGGYWPIGYRYVRYYWYGCHPYYWYGYYPIAREVMTDTYNYYTYNYYGFDDTAVCESGQTTDYMGLVDHNTFADVRKKLAQQAAGEPDEATLADSFFEDAVKAFEAADYDKAIEMFANASKVAPDDIILPFAHSQALFAKEQYSQAVEVLRAALTKVPPEKEGAPPPKGEQEVFYPRGLYPDDDTLFEQIDHLAEKAELYSFDADLQLLLGYQLLGIGQIDEALEPLLRASKDMKNADAAAILLRLLEKIRAQDSEGENTD